MRVLLDACVLYRDLLREILLNMAAEGCFSPLWSDRILEEWRRAVAREGGDVGARIALLGMAHPKASVVTDPAVGDRLSLPDPNDVHVLAAAIVAEADVLLTLNLKDFPPRTVAREGIRVMHPDALSIELLSGQRAPVVAAVERAVSDMELAQPHRAHLKRAGLPRLAKALA